MVMMLVSLWTISGCGRTAPPPNPVPPEGGGMPFSAPSGSSVPMGSPAPMMPMAGSQPQFLDFPDIPIPTELKLDEQNSFVFEAGGFKTGILTLRGRVDTKSVIAFFQAVMPRENWKPRGGFSYRKSVLIFEKPDKTCVINMYDTLYYTYVEIYVAPISAQL
jgi:hypothetical protein